jgi:hypothetical protein
MKLPSWVIQVWDSMFGRQQAPPQNPPQIQKITQLLHYPDVWPTHTTLIAQVLQSRVTHLSRVLADPPGLFLPPDNEFTNACNEVRRLIGEPIITTLDAARIEGFAERVYSGMIVVVKESAWQSFSNKTPWAVGTIAHELAHVEEQYRFGPHPGNSGAGKEALLANLRKVWSEFFAEQIASPLYDQRQLGRYLLGLTELIHQRDIFEIPNHLGRIAGHASGRGKTAKEIAQILAPHGREYSRAGEELTDLLTAAMQNGQLPDFDRLHEVLKHTVL